MFKIILSIFITTLTLFANNFKDLTSYQASFKQSIINNSGKEILYNGNIYIKEPSQILWRYTKPIEKDVYINLEIINILGDNLRRFRLCNLIKDT